MILANKRGIDKFQSSLQQYGLQWDIEHYAVECFYSIRFSPK